MYNYKENVGVWEMNNKFQNTKEREKERKRTTEQEEQLNTNITVTTVNGNDSKKRCILFKMDFLKTQLYGCLQEK